MRRRGAQGRPRTEPQKLGPAITRVLADLGLGDAGRVLRLTERWEAAVGPEVARHCRPLRLRGSLLEARVDTNAWCQELLLKRPALLAALRRELGDEAPTELRLHVG